MTGGRSTGLRWAVVPEPALCEIHRERRQCDRSHPPCRGLWINKSDLRRSTGLHRGGRPGARRCGFVERRQSRSVAIRAAVLVRPNYDLRRSYRGCSGGGRPSAVPREPGATLVAIGRKSRRRGLVHWLNRGLASFTGNRYGFGRGARPPATPRAHRLLAVVRAFQPPHGEGPRLDGRKWSMNIRLIVAPRRRRCPARACRRPLR